MTFQCATLPRLAALLIFLPFLLHAQAARNFDLVPDDPSCACVRTHKETKLLISRELTINGKVYQAFFERQSNKEVFRVYIGDPDSSLWNYGIAAEGDYTGDGIPDYSWFGGDDTSRSNYLFFSCPSGYCAIDVLRTFSAEWAPRFHTKRPDLEAIGDYNVSDLQLIGSSDATSLSARIEKMQDPRRAPVKLRVLRSKFLRPIPSMPPPVRP